MLRAAGVRRIVGVDIHGIVHPDRAEGMNPYLRKFASEVATEGFEGTIHDAIEGADVFIGVSAPNLITADDVRRMNKDPIVFALANPDPEVDPAEIEGVARIIATGR